MNFFTSMRTNLATAKAGIARLLTAALVLATAFTSALAQTYTQQYQDPPQEQQQQPPPPQSVGQTTHAANERKNSIALDLFPLFKGAVESNENFSDFSISIAYERLIAPHFSVGPDLELYFMNFDGVDYMHFYFSLVAEGRYYPNANFDKFFLGTTLGFNVLAVDGKTSANYGGFSGLTTSLKMGYKVILSQSFYAEPSLSWVLSKSGASVPTPSGWQGGLRLGCSF